jgi:hypothetical protein
VKDWERREAEMHKEFCRSRLVDEAEQDDDKLDDGERHVVELAREWVADGSGAGSHLRVRNLVAIVDRLAPKPTPKETVEDVLRAMKLETPRCEMWANRIEAALKGGAR